MTWDLVPEDLGPVLERPLPSCVILRKDLALPIGKSGQVLGVYDFLKKFQE